MAFTKAIKLGFDFSAFSKAVDTIDTSFTKLGDKLFGKEVFSKFGKGIKGAADSFTTKIGNMGKNNSMMNGLRQKVIMQNKKIMAANQAKIAAGHKGVNLTDGVQNVGKGAGMMMLAAVADKFKQKIEKVFKDLAGKIKDYFVNLIKEAIEELKQMTGYDSKGSGYTSEAWEQQISLGLSDSENFALTKALNKMNMNMEEYWMGGYNNERFKEFNKFYDLYKEEYAEIQASGFLTNIQQMKMKFEQMQEDFKKTVMKFIVDNGDTIMAVLNGILSVLGFIFDGIKTLTALWSDDTLTDYEIDKNIDNVIANNSSTQNNNISINNTMNSTSPGVTNIQQMKKATGENYRHIGNAIKLR